MSRPRLFKGGSVASEARAKPEPADVLVDERGEIAAVESGLEASDGVEVFDCANKILIPGLFDMNVHLREPGREDMETIETGAEAAINGGVTGILAMPNTDPPIDSGGMVRFVLTLARDRARIPVHTAGCITRGRAGAELAEIGDMHANGAVMITDIGSPVADPYVLRRALEYARSFDMIVASHCETPTLSGEGAMNEGAASYRLGIPGLPAISEEICIDRDLRIAQYTEGRIHIHHVTTARGVDIIRRFKEAGVRVTAEACPHHLIFSEDDIKNYDTHLKMNPPLRRPEDREALFAAVEEGVIDVIVSDHAPHSAFEKNEDFVNAPFGITGLDTGLLSLYTHFVKPGRMGWDLLVKTCSAEPRRILSLKPAEIRAGATAEFLVFDPEAVTRCDRPFMRSKSSNSPFLDRDLDGSVEKVVLADRLLLDRPGGDAP